MDYYYYYQHKTDYFICMICADDDTWQIIQVQTTEGRESICRYDGYYRDYFVDLSKKPISSHKFHEEADKVSSILSKITRYYGSPTH